MYIVGIDYSITHASYCITRDFDEYWFGSIVNPTKMPKKTLDVLSDLSKKSNGYINFTITKRVNACVDYDGMTYQESERVKLINHMHVSNVLANKIIDCTGNLPDTLVGMEGYSYSSEGSAVFDTAQATGMFRRELMLSVLKNDVNKLFVFSPSELKNSIGCKGNAAKSEIFNAFIEDPVLPKLKSTVFYNYIVDNKDDKVLRVTKDDKSVIKSPFNDIIDACLPVMKIYKTING